MRGASSIASMLILLSASGCGKFQFLRGRVVESDRSSYDIVDSESDLNRRIAQGVPILPTGCKVYQPSDQGPREQDHVHFKALDDRERGCFTIWWQFVYDPEWPRGWKVMVERIGYEPIWIAAEELPPDVDSKYLLIRLKKAN